MMYVQGSNTSGENSASADTASAIGTSHDKDEYILYDDTIKWKMSTNIKWITGYIKPNKRIYNFNIPLTTIRFTIFTNTASEMSRSTPLEMM